MFVEVANEKYFVDINLGFPRFFREKFAIALGVGNRADWKAAENNEVLMRDLGKDIIALKEKWKNAFN